MRVKTYEYNSLVSAAPTSLKSEEFLNQTYKNLEVAMSHDECWRFIVSILNTHTKQNKHGQWVYNEFAKGIIKNTENSILSCEMFKNAY